MAKQQTKKFQSNADGPVSVSVPGHGVFHFVPGERRSLETDDADLIAAFTANPDLVEVRDSKKK